MSEKRDTDYPPDKKDKDPYPHNNNPTEKLPTKMPDEPKQSDKEQEKKPVHKPDTDASS